MEVERTVIDILVDVLLSQALRIRDLYSKQVAGSRSVSIESRQELDEIESILAPYFDWASYKFSLGGSSLDTFMVELTSVRIGIKQVYTQKLRRMLLNYARIRTREATIGMTIDEIIAVGMASASPEVESAGTDLNLQMDDLVKYFDKGVMMQLVTYQRMWPRKLPDHIIGASIEARELLYRLNSDAPIMDLMNGTAAMYAHDDYLEGIFDVAEARRGDFSPATTFGIAWPATGIVPGDYTYDGRTMFHAWNVDAQGGPFTEEDILVFNSAANQRFVVNSRNYNYDLTVQGDDTNWEPLVVRYYVNNELMHTVNVPAVPNTNGIVREQDIVEDNTTYYLRTDDVVRVTLYSIRHSHAVGISYNVDTYSNHSPEGPFDLEMPIDTMETRDITAVDTFKQLINAALPAFADLDLRQYMFYSLMEELAGWRSCYRYLKNSGYDANLTYKYRMYFHDPDSVMRPIDWLNMGTVIGPIGNLLKEVQIDLTLVFELAGGSIL
jgi:hypothetical protein